MEWGHSPSDFGAVVARRIVAPVFQTVGEAPPVGCSNHPSQNRAPVTQSVECEAVNLKAVGSRPTGSDF